MIAFPPNVVEYPLSLIMNRLPLFLLPLLITALPLHADPPALKIQNGAKIAFLGDSITAQGWGNPGGYVNLVVKGLAAEGVTVTPIPAGVSGHTSRDMIARLDRDVLSKSPDWMTLSCGVNDVWHGGAGGVPLDEYKTKITSIVDQAQAKGIKVMIMTSTCIYEDDNVSNQKLAAYNDFLRQLATEKHCLLADESALYANALKASPPPHGTKLVTADGVHPNPLGHMLMARGILQAFGVPDADFPKIESAWAAIPAGARLTSGLNVSINSDITLADYQILEKVAADKNTNVNGLTNLWFLAASHQVFDAHAQDTAPDFDKIKLEIQQIFDADLKAVLPPAPVNTLPAK
jgi:lysophospholipase L1-like esterase